jgi:hypothetical protein
MIPYVIGENLILLVKRLKLLLNDKERILKIQEDSKMDTSKKVLKRKEYLKQIGNAMRVIYSIIHQYYILPVAVSISFQNSRVLSAPKFLALLNLFQNYSRPNCSLLFTSIRKLSRHLYSHACTNSSVNSPALI